MSDMPDDTQMSAEQETELSEDELQTLFEQTDEESPDGDDSSQDETDDEEENPDDDQDSEEEDSDDSEDSDDEDGEDQDEDSDDDDDDDDEDDSEDDPLSQLKKEAAALKRQEQEAQNQEAAEKERAEKISTAKADVLKEIFGQETISIDGKEVNIKELQEEYGDGIDALVTARAYQIVEPLMDKVLESAGFASKDDLKQIQAENAELKFMSEVAQSHPEIWQLKNDDKFWSWADSQGDDVKLLLEKGGVQGVSSVIGAYKKAVISKTNQKIDKSARQKQKKHTDLHSSTLRSKGKKRTGSKKNDGVMSDAEYEATFNEIEVTD